MPADERPPAAPRLSSPEWLALLAEGDLEIEGQMPWSSNITLLVWVRCGELEARAIYKPGEGERSLWDFPPGLYRHEAAAYRLADAVGLPVVPETVLRDGPFGEGSLQRFIDADFSQHYFTLLEEPARHDALRLVAGYDLLANNADRKGGHFLLDADGQIWGIDNGLCFHPQPKLRTVAWDFAGEPLPDAVIEACARLSEELGEPLVALLTPREARALRARARALLEHPVFPHPDLEEHCYPWPLV
ncbi:MAG: SCO1664 family protein [Actinomycetota bacterium]|nr:SCO1664 family protein [Actinomycetota bacterium]